MRTEWSEIDVGVACEHDIRELGGVIFRSPGR